MEPDARGHAIWNACYKMSSFEVDPTKKATVQTLCKIMQEAAWDHADVLGLGYPQMIEKDLIWVLSRQKIKVHHFPKWGETIRLKTWPTGAQRLFAFREFQIFDEKDALIAEAKGAWLVLDSKSRRPIRVEPLFAQMEIPTEKGLFQGDLEKLPSPKDYSMQPHFPVQYSDLDWYNHVNHVQYIEWILDSYPLETHGRFCTASLEMDFLSESRYGDEISVCTRELGEDPPSYLHSLLRKRDDQEICVACINWRERTEENGG